jgi:2-haloacid dehalogenase
MMSRRSVIALGAAGIGAGWTVPSWARSTADPDSIEAVAFDAFAIFDPRPVFDACESAFPGRGAQLAALWRTRQFEYQWLRALSRQYTDFWSATRSALEFAARSLNLNLSAAQRDQLMKGYLSLTTWPDVPPALAALRNSGRRLIVLSNATDQILRSSVRNAGLEGVFDELLSTDEIKSFKPDPRAYHLGIDKLRLPPAKILFVAFAGWDAAGAKWFGYPTFWNNRQKAPLEMLDANPDGMGESLKDVVKFAASCRTASHQPSSCRRA